MGGLSIWSFLAMQFLTMLSFGSKENLKGLSMYVSASKLSCNTHVINFTQALLSFLKCGDVFFMLWLLCGSAVKPFQKPALAARHIDENSLTLCKFVSYVNPS